MPAHSHNLSLPASSDTATLTSPTGAVPAATKGNAKTYGPAPGNTTMATAVTSNAGGGAPVPVRSPFVTVTCAIAVEGIFPSRN
jgi:microcystin-dependent protein